MKSLIAILIFAAMFNSSSVCGQPSPAQKYDFTTSWECGTMQLLGLYAAKNTTDVSTPTPGSITANSVNARPQNAPYTIPVVFHVISFSGNPLPLPTYSQIKMQLASLNAAFSNSLTSLNNVLTGARAVDTQIQFCFAKKQQVNGQPALWPNSTPGVIYHLVSNTITTNVNINSNASLASLAALTNANFPPGMYLNVWCVPNISTNPVTNYNAPPTVIGIGTFPWMSMPIDGIVMRNDVIGNNTYNNFPGMFTPLDKGNILAHEAGHYLGLFHTFETITGGNPAGAVAGCYGAINPMLDGDLITDTPPTMINSDVPAGIYNTCNETYFPYGGLSPPDVDDQLENFMSYSADYKMNTFTAGQALRMKGALDLSYPSTLLTAQRSNLVSQVNLNSTGVNTAPSCGPALLSSAFSTSLIMSSITCNSAAVQFYQPVLPGYLSATSFTWNFGDGSTSNATNPLHTYNAPFANYTVTLISSNGQLNDTTSKLVYLPNLVAPQIAGFSGMGHAVCRGTEQTILVQFPPFVLSAILTDGTNNYPVTSNIVHNNSNLNGVYKFPFTFTISGSASFSLVGNCGMPGIGVASFTVNDCCQNLITNGDFENGPVGFVSDYTLNATSTNGGFAAINFPLLTSYPAFANESNNTGKMLILDSAPGYAGCGLSGFQRLIVQQDFTGMKPSTNYYIAVKTGQSADSLSYCPNKFNMRLLEPSGTVLTNTFITSTVPPFSWFVANSGASLTGSKQITNFVITTPANINSATVFTLQLFEVENASGNGFDYSFDNIIVSEMNPPILVSPLSSAYCPGGSVQLNASSNCANIGNYTLLWLPGTALSCSTCPNPVASPSVSTIYTLLAIPPISTPPGQNLAITVTITVNSLLAAAPQATIVCPNSQTQLTATSSCLNLNNYSVSWMPQQNLSCTTCTNPISSPSVTTVYTVTAVPPVSIPPLPNQVATTTVFVSNPLQISPQATAICQGSSLDFGVSFICTGYQDYSLNWQPQGSISCVNCVNPSAFPTVTTIYTLTATPPASLSALGILTATAVVNVLPTPTATLSAILPTPLCNPSNYTLAAAGVSTVTWQPTGLTGTPISVTPTSPLVYTAYYTGPLNTCQNSSTISISPPPAVSVAVNGGSVYCVNAGPLTLTATASPGGASATFTWLPGILNGAIQSFSPSANTVYTVMATLNGCPVTKTVAVQRILRCVWPGFDEQIEPGQDEIELFPNPNNGSFKLRSEQVTELLIVKLSEISGKVILLDTVTIKNFVTDLELNIAEGMYILEVSSVRKKTYHRLVISR